MLARSDLAKGDQAGEGEVSAAGSDDDKIHHDEHRVVSPTVGSEFASEARVPDECLHRRAIATTRVSPIRKR